MEPELHPPAADAPFLRRLALVALALVAAVLVYRMMDILLLAFGSVLVAVTLATGADLLAARTGLRRGICLAVATLLFLGVIGLIGWLFGTETGSQIGKLKQTLPQDWARVRIGLEGNPIGKMIVDSVRAGAAGAVVARYAAGLGLGVVEGFANFLIILVGGVFFAADPALYRGGLVRLAPPRYRHAIAPALHNVGRALRLWLTTQIVSMVLMGIMIGLGLWWSGVETPIALGLLGGLSEFIPYVGPTLAMVPAIIVALAGPGSIWGVLATYAIVRLVQANLITPLISQRLVSVPPALYLFLILAMGQVFGTFGLFFAGALSVAGYTLFVHLLSRDTYGDDVVVPGEHGGRDAG